MTNKQVLSEVKSIIHDRMDKYCCGQIPGIREDLLTKIVVLQKSLAPKRKPKKE